jgi:hypothetical protein
MRVRVYTRERAGARLPQTQPRCKHLFTRPKHLGPPTSDQAPRHPTPPPRHPHLRHPSRTWDRPPSDADRRPAPTLPRAPRAPRRPFQRVPSPASFASFGPASLGQRHDSRPCARPTPAPTPTDDLSEIPRLHLQPPLRVSYRLESQPPQPDRYLSASPSPTSASVRRLSPPA